MDHVQPYQGQNFDVHNFLQLCADRDIDISFTPSQTAAASSAPELAQDAASGVSDEKRRLRSQRYRDRKRNHLYDLKIATLDLHEKCLQLFHQQKVQYVGCFSI